MLNCWSTGQALQVKHLTTDLLEIDFLLKQVQSVMQQLPEYQLKSIDIFMWIIFPKVELGLHLEQIFPTLPDQALAAIKVLATPIPNFWEVALHSTTAVLEYLRPIMSVPHLILS